MTADAAIEMCRQAVMVTLLLSAPVMAAALVVGLVISIGQAVTQLQDQTMTFVPKLVAMVLVLLYTLPWTLHVLVEYAGDLFRNIPSTLS